MALDWAGRPLRRRRTRLRAGPRALCAREVACV